MKAAILFVNPEKENAYTLAKEITRELEQRNFTVRVSTFGETAQEGARPSAGAYDLAFSLGGDGTVLSAARAMAPLGTPVFPINLGTLGFIAAVHPEDWVRVFDSWLAGAAPLSGRLMLEARVERGGAETARLCCLNDIVFSSSGIAKIIRLDVTAKTGETLTSLGQYRSDGLILATPTGSTAYSVAAGGPILDPEMEALILNPVCPFTLSYRPMVLPSSETLIVEVERKQRSAVILTVDGQVTEALEPGDRIFVSRAPHKAILVASGRTVFYHALKTKLSWLETPGSNQSVKSGAAHA